MNFFEMYELINLSEAAAIDVISSDPTAKSLFIQYSKNPEELDRAHVLADFLEEQGVEDAPNVREAINKFDEIRKAYISALGNKDSDRAREVRLRFDKMGYNRDKFPIQYFYMTGTLINIMDHILRMRSDFVNTEALKKYFDFAADSFKNKKTIDYYSDHWVENIFSKIGTTVGARDDNRRRNSDNLEEFNLWGEICNFTMDMGMISRRVSY